MTDTRNIVWLASYPKSGNTWARFMVSHLLKGSALEKSGEIESYTPDIHKQTPQNLPDRPGPLHVKTHWRLTSDMPCHNECRSAIYVVRHPGDVLVSCLAYLNVPRKRQEPVIEQFIDLGGLELWRTLGFGTWIENVTSWLDAEPAINVNLLRYEDMVAAPAEAVRTLARLLGRPVSDDLAAEIAHETRFSNMRAMELREKNRKLPKEDSFFCDESANKKAKINFMNAGRTRRYEKLLAPQQKLRFERTFGPLMRRLGY